MTRAFVAAFLAAALSVASAGNALAAAGKARRHGQPPVILASWGAYSNYSEPPPDGYVQVVVAVRNATRVTWSVQRPYLGSIVLHNRGPVRVPATDRESGVPASAIFGPCAGGWNRSEFHVSPYAAQLRYDLAPTLVPNRMCGDYREWAGMTTNAAFAGAFSGQIGDNSTSPGALSREFVLACNPWGCTRRHLRLYVQKRIGFWTRDGRAVWQFP